MTTRRAPRPGTEPAGEARSTHRAGTSPDLRAARTRAGADRSALA